MRQEGERCLALSESPPGRHVVSDWRNVFLLQILHGTYRLQARSNKSVIPFGSSLLFLVLGLPWPGLVCSGLALAVFGCCWLLLAALVLGPGVPWLAALLWLFLAVVGCCCWWLFAGPGRLWLFLAISGRHGSGLGWPGSPLCLECCSLLLAAKRSQTQPRPGKSSQQQPATASNSQQQPRQSGEPGQPSPDP